MQRIARARPTEYLVISRSGRLYDAGLGGRAWLWPGADFVTVPAVKQEATFAMTQESQDGIPLRFKGIVVFAVTDPIRAASCFDFASDAGLADLRELIAHVCLGELRDRVSHMAMSDCIEQRKTTLSTAVEGALREVANREGEGWGIGIDLVQIAQVFIVDDELRTRLEARVRDEVEATSERSRIDKEEAVERARLTSERRLMRESLDLERDHGRAEQERLAVARELAERRLKLEGPQRRAELEDQRQTIEVEIAMRRLANELRTLEVTGELARAQAEAAIEREMLPQRQVPEVAAALAQVFAGANLSVYGSDAQILRTVQPLVDLLVRRGQGGPVNSG